MSYFLSLKDPECFTILLNCIKKRKEKQIKGKSHLQELSDAVDFITKKFDKYEQERKEREEIINNLTENVSRLAQKKDDFSEAVEKQEYSRCNYLLRHGIPEKKQENTSELCVKAINEHLDLATNDRNIDRTHRIGDPRNADEKPRPIIIKLLQSRKV